LADKFVLVRREVGFRHNVSVRGHRFAVDEPLPLGGSDTAASPLELLAASLGACTASTIEMYAERKGWDVGAVEVDVHFVPPRKPEPGSFELTIRLPASLTDEQVERLESIGRACPVRRTLEGATVTERLERV
jgi:putative redox protein